MNLAVLQLLIALLTATSQVLVEVAKMPREKRPTNRKRCFYPQGRHLPSRNPFNK
jgi:hypothetical protein